MTLPKRSCMKVTGLALACSSLLFSCAPKEVPQVNLIPKPAHIEVTGGYFKVDSNLINRVRSVTWSMSLSMAEIRRDMR
jgi:hexosaminidase